MLAEEAEAIDDQFFFNTPVLTARTLELARWSTAALFAGAPITTSDCIAGSSERLEPRTTLRTASRRSLRRSSNISQSSNATTTSARLQVAHGMVLASKDDIEGAFAALGKAADCRRRLGDHTREAVTRARRHTCLANPGSTTERAGDLLEAALALPTVDHNPQLRALLVGELALYHVDLGRSRKPIRSSPRSWPIHDSTGRSYRWRPWAVGETSRWPVMSSTSRLHRYAHTLRAARVMPNQRTVHLRRDRSRVSRAG